MSTIERMNSRIRATLDRDPANTCRVGAWNSRDWSIGDKYLFRCWLTDRLSNSNDVIAESAAHDRMIKVLSGSFELVVWELSAGSGHTLHENDKLDRFTGLTATCRVAVSRTAFVKAGSIVSIRPLSRSSILIEHGKKERRVPHRVIEKISPTRVDPVPSPTPSIVNDISNHISLMTLQSRMFVYDAIVVVEDGWESRNATHIPKRTKTCAFSTCNVQIPRSNKSGYCGEHYQIMSGGEVNE